MTRERGKCNTLQSYSVCTSRNSTELMQVVDFTGLMDVCHQVAASLLASTSCAKSVKIRFDETDIWGLSGRC